MKTIYKAIRISFLLIVVLLQKNVSGNIYTVTSTADAGAGTLRQAILNANANAGLDTIRFAILPVGNLIESSGLNTYAVIQINTALATITSPVFIDGFSQTDTNLGNIAGKTVGVDNIVQSAIPYPDVYIVPSNSYSLPSTSGMTGNCFTIDVNDVHIRGVAISGWGNTNSASGTASGNAEIMVLRSSPSRIINLNINNNFLGCDPRGNFPSLSHRRSKGNGVLVGGGNAVGTISNNYIAHAGTYGIHFNGLVDINSEGGSGVLQSREFVINGNQLINVSTNTLVTSGQVADAINTMKCNRFIITENYIENVEQVGIDFGYNADSNYAANNTITGFVKTVQIAPQVGIRMGLSSQRDTVYKNLIYNNTGANFKGGVWIDESSISQTGVVIRPNAFNYIRENIIHSNRGSGILLSNNGTSAATSNIISQNSTYNNTGLGIDLNYNGTTGPTAISVNDDGDVDAGTNNIQNFAVIDSVKRFSETVFGFYGKAPAGATLEFFLTDAGVNNHGGLTMNYGEGQTYIGTAVEGSAADGATGTGSYNIDGNVATNNVNMYFLMLTYTGSYTVLSDATVTATVSNNTSEYGPVITVMEALGSTLSAFHGSYYQQKVNLTWNAISDDISRTFEIEHSTNGNTFSKAGLVKAKATGKFVDYDFTHLYPIKGANYYRLKMRKPDGTHNYSAVIKVDVEDVNVSEVWRIKNTIFQSKIDFTFLSNEQIRVSLQLVDQHGKVIRNTDVNALPGLNFFTFDQLSALPAGTYYVFCKSNTGKFTGRVMKQ